MAAPPNADPPKAGAPKALVVGAAGLEPNAEPRKALGAVLDVPLPEKAPKPSPPLAGVAVEPKGLPPKALPVVEPRVPPEPNAEGFDAPNAEPPDPKALPVFPNVLPELPKALVVALEPKAPKPPGRAGVELTAAAGDAPKAEVVGAGLWPSPVTSLDAYSNAWSRLPRIF